jgi:tetratricopeptide (TPR) repeat protein
VTEPLTHVDELESAFDRELMARVQERRTKRLEEMGLEGVIWLALAPSWTVRLAVACGFPAEPRTIEEFVAAAEGAGFCTTARSARPQAAASYELRALSAFAPYLSKKRVERALELAEHVPDDTSRAKALAELAPVLARPELDRAATVARQIAGPGERATALLALSQRIEDGVGTLVEEALEAARQTVDTAVRARLLTVLYDIVPAESQSELGREALAAASEIAMPEERTAALAALVPKVGSEAEAALLDTLEAIGEKSVRAELSLSYLSLVPEAQRLELAKKSADLVETEGSGPSPTATLVAVEGLSSAGERAAAEDAAAAIDEHDARALAYGVVARAASEAGDTDSATRLVDRGLASLEATVKPSSTAATLAGIAQTLANGGERGRALRLAHEALRVVDEQPPTTDLLPALRLLTALLFQLGDADLARRAALKALQTIRKIGSPRERAASFLAILPTLPDEPSRILPAVETLEALETLADPFDRVGLLAALLPYLDATNREHAIESSLRLATEAPTEVSFRMPDAVRAELASLVSGRGGGIQFDVHDKVGEIADRMVEARKDGVAVPPPVLRWATLGSRLRGGGVTDVVTGFADEVTGALAARDIAGALDWIDTGAALAEPLGDELAAMVRYAKRRVELIYRRIQDERYLEDFLERGEQITAFRELLDDRGQAWALHYIGAGGVGKTMLLRYLSEYATQQGRLTSRVDFDYLSPDYPFRRPGELLLALMAELELYASSERDEGVIRSFRDNVVKLHETTLEGTPDHASSPLDSPGFESALRSFCGYLELIERPVVLFLDTCEELAKYQPEGSRLPNVEATFEVIERIRAKVPTVRVVFAGRRLLTEEGRDWNLENPRDGARAMLPAKRDYLRLQEIRGFTEDEARAYFTRIKKLEVSADVEAAILERSPDAGTVADITWDRERHSADVPRYNPFDLAMYAEWVATGPVTAAELRAPDTDVYIDRRIVGRVRSDDLRKLLPAVALLRRFDADLLRTAFDGPESAFLEAFAMLRNEEWIDVRRDGESGYLQVDPNIYPRLRAYYEEGPRRAVLTRAGSRLGPVLTKRIDDASLGELSAELVNSALDVLTPRDATALWHRISLRVAKDARWDWARQVAGWLLGEEGSVHRPGHPARSAVRATLASALVHLEPTTDPTSQWLEVADSARRDPDAAARDWLTARARCGLITAAAATPPGPTDEAIGEFRKVLDDFPGSLQPPDPDDALVLAEQLAASCCAAAEAVVELAEVTRQPLLANGELVAWIGRLATAGVSKDLQAFARVLAARLLALEGRWLEADEQLTAARLEVSSHADHGHWLDWVAPMHLSDRIGLEALRVVPPLLGTAPRHELLEGLGDIAERVASIDGERLASAALAARLARGPVDASELQSLTAADSYDPQRQPICAAHHAVSPLFIEVAAGLLAIGDAARAMSVLDGRLLAATESGRDPATVRAAELAKLAVLRRMRIGDGDPVLVNRLARSPVPSDAAAALSVIALTRGSDERDELDRADGSPTPWRFLSLRDVADIAGQTVLRPGSGEEVAPPAPPTIDAASDAVDVDSALDVVECRRLVSRRARGTRQSDVEFVPDTWLAAHPHETEWAVRLTLRAAALDALRVPLDLDAVPIVDADTPPSLLETWAERLGYRRVGELALEEGELMALRLPQEALALLRVARRCFVRSGDPVGGLLALIRATLAEAHAGAVGVDRSAVAAELRVACADVSSADVLREGFDFEQFVEQAKRPDPGFFADLVSPQRSGWLQRLYLALVWCSLDDGERPPRLAETREGVAPPIELDLHLSGPEESEQSFVFKVLRALGFVAVGIAVWFAAGALAAWLVRLGAGVLGIDLSWPAAVAVVVALLAVGSAAWYWLRSVRRLAGAFVAARRPLRLVVTTQGGTEAATAPWRDGLPVELMLQQRSIGMSARGLSLVFAFGIATKLLLTILPGRSGIFQLGDVTSSVGGWRTPLLGPYGADVRSLPAPVVDELRDLRDALWRSTLAVPLEIPPVVAGLPWEAFITEGTAPSEEGDGSIVAYRRTSARSSARSAASSRPFDIGVVASRTWQQMAVEGWRPWRDTVAVFEDMQEVWPQEDSLAVLHLVGRPVSSPSGYLFQVAAGSRLGSDVERSVRASGAMIRPDALSVSPSTLLLVQSEPYETATRLDTDREEAAKLRLFATDAFSAGAWAAVTIPALPRELALKVLTALARDLRRRRRGDPRRWLETLLRKAQRRAGMPGAPETERLIEAVGRARTLVSNWRTVEPSSDDEGLTYLELSYDICLLLRNELPDFDVATAGPRGKKKATAPS